MQLCRLAFISFIGRYIYVTDNVVTQFYIHTYVHTHTHIYIHPLYTQFYGIHMHMYIPYHFLLHKSYQTLLLCPLL